MTKPDLQKEIDRLNKLAVTRQNQLLSEDPEFRDLNAQLLWARKWMESMGGDGENEKPGKPAPKNGKAKDPKPPEKVEA